MSFVFFRSDPRKPVEARDARQTGRRELNTAEEL